MEKMSKNLLPENGEVLYFPDFVKESSKYFKYLLNEIAWIQEPIWMFGKKVMQPRLTALYGDPDIPYGYSGIKMRSHPITQELIHLQSVVEKKSNTKFTHVLLNLYRDGQDSMGWHRDNEKVLGPEPVIASLSFGAARNFQLRPYFQKKPVITQLLEEGSLLLMQGTSQEYWEHQLPKTRKPVGVRINLTFRSINPQAKATFRNL
jgi:alkylated DNA repair dioxygenase AlkB